MILMPELAEPRSANCLAKMLRLRAREIDESGIRIEIADALQERRKVGIGERNTDRLDDLAAGLEEAGLERGLGFDPRRPIVDQVTTRLLPFLAAHSAMIQDC